MSESNTHARLEYVDRLRGLAVVAMFYVHAAVAWLLPSIEGTAYWKVISRTSGMVAPTFMFLAGLSVAMIADAGRRKGLPEDRVRWRVCRRGLEIWAIGYGLHFAFWILGGFHAPWIRAFKVDILHCIGLAMAVVPWIAWPRKRFAWSALILTLVTMVLGELLMRLPVAESLPRPLGAYFSPDRTIGLFPPLPYSAWVFFGVFVGALFTTVARGQDARAERRFFIGIAVAAALLYVASDLGHKLYYQLGVNLWPSSERVKRVTMHLLIAKSAWVLGFFLVARLTTRWLDRVPADFLTLFGRRSLFAYCVHLILIYHVGNHWLRKGLEPAEQILASAGLTAVMLGLVLGLDRAARSSPRWVATLRRRG